jgi:hypothetical protein
LISVTRTEMIAAMIRGSLVCVALLLAVGCGSTSVATIQTTRYVAYSVVSDTSLDRDPPPVAPPKAVNALQKMKRVAFVPPDICLDMRAGDTSTTVDKRVIRMQCGVTMSELEREAEKAGFDVVTWQSLKGGTRPLEEAKNQKIDLLFEVNELDVVEDNDRASNLEFRYFTGDGNAPPQPLQVTAEDNEACKAYHARSAPQVSGMTSVLDIKMVQVTNGSVLWSYRHEENMRAAEATGLVRFPVSGRQTYKTARPWWPIALIAIGIPVAFFVSPPYIGAAISTVGIIAAIAVGKKTERVGEPELEPPGYVLCRRQHIIDMPVPQAPVAPVRSDTFHEQSRTSNKDYAEERRRELIKRSVATFMGQLTKANR